MKIKLTEEQLNRILLKEGYSTNELFNEKLYSIGDLKATIQTSMKNPEILDDFDFTPVDKLMKTKRKSLADNFLKRLNKNSSEEEMVKAFYDAINVTYNNDKFINEINAIITLIWKDLDGGVKALVNLGWATTRKSTIINRIKTMISQQIFIDIIAIDEAQNDQFNYLFGKSWSNNYKAPYGAGLIIDNEVVAAYKTKGKGPFPYNIDHITDQIYNTLDNL